MMASDSPAELLSPEGGVLTDPGQVERAIADIWRLPDDGIIGSEAKTATRVSVGNLIVVGRADDWHGLSLVLGELSPEYPTRTVVVLLEEPVALQALPATAPVRASISAICHAPQPGRLQVCCDQIVLRVAPAAETDLHRTILPLLESDVPAVLWWTPAPGSHLLLLKHLRSIADRLVLDAGSLGVLALSPGERAPDKRPPDRCVVRELGWYRTYRWRQLVAEALDAWATETLARIDHVAITVASGLAEDRIDGLWLAAFLGGQLGWRAGAAGDGGTFRFGWDAGVVKVSMRAANAAGRGLQSLKLEARGSTLDIQRRAAGGDEYQLIVCDERTCTLPRSVEVRQLSRAQALASAFTGRRVDAAFERAAPLAAWMAGGWRP